MTVDRQKQQNGEDGVELTDHRHLHTVLRVDRHGEAQAHAHGDAMPRHDHGAKDQLHHKAHGQTDQQLPHHEEKPRRRERVHGNFCWQQGHREHGYREAEDNAGAHVEIGRAEDRRRQHHGRHAQERPQVDLEQLHDIVGCKDHGVSPQQAGDIHDQAPGEGHHHL